MIREPSVSGQFYPDNPDDLRAMITSFVDPHAEKEDAVGAVVPHAGYIYSGAVAGAVISRIKFKDTFIIIGPNHTGQGLPLSIMTEGTWRTPLGDVSIDTELAQKLASISRYLKPDTLAHQNEHSVEVQLPFLQYFQPDIKIVPVVLACGDPAVLQSIGREIAQALQETRREAVILASSDMNHYEPQRITRKKDFMAIDAMLDMDAAELIRQIEKNDISMCGYAPAGVMLTAASELGAAKAELIKYQTSGDVSGELNAVVGYAGLIVKKLSPMVMLAKAALESYIRDRKIIQVKNPTPEMQERAGTFVCIKKDGELRGCIGTFEPFQDNVAYEIIANAISTATHDPRFEPVRPSELKYLDYTVDVLTRPEPVESEADLDPKKYGVIVESGYRRGLLLPDLEGVDTVAQQIEICREKGGISPNEPVRLYRFEVKRYK